MNQEQALLSLKTTPRPVATLRAPRPQTASAPDGGAPWVSAVPTFEVKPLNQFLRGSQESGSENFRSYAILGLSPEQDEETLNAFAACMARRSASGFRKSCSISLSGDPLGRNDDHLQQLRTRVDRLLKNDSTACDRAIKEHPGSQITCSYMHSP